MIWSSNHTSFAKLLLPMSDCGQDLLPTVTSIIVAIPVTYWLSMSCSLALETAAGKGERTLHRVCG